MRRVIKFLRRIFLLSAFVSLLLFVIMLSLWARSLGHCEGCAFADGRLTGGECRYCLIYVMSCNGGTGLHVMLRRATGRDRSNIPFSATCPLKAMFSVEARAATVPTAYPGSEMEPLPWHEDRPYCRGAGWGWRGFIYAHLNSHDLKVDSRTRQWFLTVPDWFGVLATAALPSLWLLRRLWSRRCRPGFCRKCGYDLRATPRICPECGTQANA